MIVGKKTVKDPAATAPLGKQHHYQQNQMTPQGTHKKYMAMKAYALGSRNACKMNSRLNCLEPPALSCRRVSRSQILSESVRKVAFSGFW